jgi:hypothetical protein
MNHLPENRHTLKHHPLPSAVLKMCAFTLFIFMLLSISKVFAAPGAHGPNGEHLDGPSSSVATSALPRLEAKSEVFELVATLEAGKLAVLIDRFATNEPVLNASLEVESGGIKSKAKFQADQGDYALDDAKLLALLRTPGEHALIFTLAAGKDNDLLDGTLITPSNRRAKDTHDHGDHGHDHALERRVLAAGGVAALGLVGGMIWWRKRRRHAARPQGVL